MSVNITKECFPPAERCMNCLRKHRYGIMDKPELKELKRCTGCHLLTYCDKDCQREHWLKVHKDHCKLLSGRKIVDNTMHIADKCSLCTDQVKTSNSERLSSASPKTDCHVEAVTFSMRSVLGCMFRFHKDGNRCTCGIDYACPLPFELGEISGKYIGSGLDQMMGHAIKILCAMRLKSEKDSNKEQKTLSLVGSVTAVRGQLWYDILIHGVEVPLDVDEFYLSDHVKDLSRYYESSDTWWKCLSFTLDLIYKMAIGLTSLYSDSESLQDPRFGNLNDVHLDYKMKVENMNRLSKNNAWSKFQLWPAATGTQLEIVLSEGVCCVSCMTPLSGSVNLIQEDNGEDDGRPIMMSHFQEFEDLAVFCPVAGCLQTCYDDLAYRMKQDGRWQKYLQENRNFLTSSRTCDFCLKQSLSCHRCSSCCAAQYCSTTCQRKDLSFHKTVCDVWATDKSRKLPDGRNQKKIFKSRIKNKK